MHLLGLGFFGDSGVDFSSCDHGGLSTFGDSLPIGTLFAEESGLMSCGIPHRGSQFTK
jgi:hypothetical protein